jgi:hypothetical protein
LQLIFYSLLNSLSAGQPNSLCLQYLQVNFPRINPLPTVVKIINNIIAISNIISNFVINKNIPIAIGINVTNKSGIMSFQDIFLSQNFEGSPLLKNEELSLPLPNPQVLPQ